MIRNFVHSLLFPYADSNDITERTKKNKGMTNLKQIFIKAMCKNIWIYISLFKETLKWFGKQGVLRTS